RSSSLSIINPHPPPPPLFPYTTLYRAARAASHPGLGALHVDFDELGRGDSVAPADIVQRIGGDRLLAAEQWIRIEAVVALVLGIFVERQRFRTVRSSMPADQRCARRRRGVALYRLLQVKTALAVRLDCEHPSAESRRRQREGAVESDVRADIDEGHVGAEPRAEVRDLATLVYT